MFWRASKWKAPANVGFFDLYFEKKKKIDIKNDNPTTFLLTSCFPAIVASLLGRHTEPQTDTNN